MVVPDRVASSAATVAETGTRSESIRATAAALAAASSEAAYASAKLPPRPSRSALVVTSTIHSARLWKTVVEELGSAGSPPLPVVLPLAEKRGTSGNARSKYSTAAWPFSPA